MIGTKESALSPKLALRLLNQRTNNLLKGVLFFRALDMKLHQKLSLGRN